MKLTERQEKMMAGEMGEAAALAMKVQYGIGEAFDAPDMVPVNRVHISLSNQEADLWFAEKAAKAGGRFLVPATVNPGFSIEYFGKNTDTPQKEIDLMKRCGEAYRQLGARLSFSCTPYFEGNLPLFGECAAFSESSATAYVNSALGARSNAESAQSAMCAALVGAAPRYGLLIKENRRADVIVKVEARVESDFDYSLLGWTAPEKIGHGVPVFTGSGEKLSPTAEGLINLGAELNTAGKFPLFHIEGVTPEAVTLEDALGGGKAKLTVCVTQKDLDDAREKFRGSGEAPHYILLGCPHYTMEQVVRVESLLGSVRSEIPIMILVPSGVHLLCQRSGLLERLVSLNVTLITDSCVDQPCWGFMRGRNLLTDSPKCAYYTARRNLKFGVRSLEDCLAAAMKAQTGSAEEEK